MSLFGCQHDWNIKAKTFMPPRDEVMSGAESESYVERAAAGVTTVLLVCLECGEARRHEMLGAEVSLDAPAPGAAAPKEKT
jgi:hypothetical protein